MLILAGVLAVDTGYTLSSVATRSIEEVTSSAPDLLRFFQMYVQRDRGLTAELARRAERAGYRALVITVDLPFSGKRRSDFRNQFRIPAHVK